MNDTVNLLETARENETGRLLRIISGLQHDDLREFIRRVAEMKLSTVGCTPTDEIVRVAKSVVSIEDAVDSLCTF